MSSVQHDTCDTIDLANGGERVGQRRRRCARTVHWWDSDLDVRCILVADHVLGMHTDGLLWWDELGFQVTGPRSRNKPVAA